MTEDEKKIKEDEKMSKEIEYYLKELGGRTAYLMNEIATNAVMCVFIAQMAEKHQKKLNDPTDVTHDTAKLEIKHSALVALFNFIADELIPKFAKDDNLIEIAVESFHALGTEIMQRYATEHPTELSEGFKRTFGENSIENTVH